MSTGTSPYRGLTSFDEADAEYFFGRRRDAQLIAADLFAAPLTLLYGASGVGKSSVVRAGVLPLLRPRKDVVVIVFNTWQNEPLQGLRDAITKELRQLAGRKNMPAPEKRSLREWLVAVSQHFRRRVFIVLDQFEEYSLYHPFPDAFADEFADAASIDDLSVTFLLSLREEAIARLDRFEDAIPTIFDHRRRIDHLDFTAAREAIELPILRFNEKHPREKPMRVDPALIDAVLSDVRTEQIQVGDTGRGTASSAWSNRIETPYLQLVMTRLWNVEQEQHSHLLQIETFQRLGGAQIIVEDHLNGVMGKLSEDRQQLAARIFQFLVTPSAAKIAHTARDLAASALADEKVVTEVLESLSTGTERILRPVAALPERPREPRYEIFHDKLAKCILAWRAEYLKTQEIRDIKRLELERTQLALTVNVALDALNDEQRQHARRAVQLFVTESGSRIARTLHELVVESHSSFPVMSSITDQLTNSELLIRLPPLPGRPDEPRFEIAHDLLVKPLLEWAAFAKETTRRQRSWPVRTTLDLPDSELFLKLIKQKPSSTIVLGSGASASARELDQPWQPTAPFAPTSRELARQLAEECHWDVDEHASLAEVSSYFAAVYDRALLADRLQRVFQSVTYPAKIHRALARLAHSRQMLILTTTFDSLLERALDEEGVSYVVVANVPEESEKILCRPPGQGFELLSRRRLDLSATTTIVYKIFGSLQPPSLIVTEEDELELFSKFSSGHLPPYQIARRFLSSAPLFIGMSLKSWTQRLLVSSLRGRRPITRGYAVTLDASVVERRRWDLAGIQLIEMDINDFASRLENFL